MEEIAVMTRLIDVNLKSGLQGIQKVVTRTQSIMGGMTEVTKTQGRMWDIVASKLAHQYGLNIDMAYSVANLNATKKETVDIVYDTLRSLRDETRARGELLGLSKETIAGMTSQFDLTKKDIAGWGSREEIMNKMMTTQKKTTKGSQKFRMELLSVMFFGQALKQTFMGLLKPALEVTGIFDLLTATLKVVFLPIAMVLLKLLLPIFKWFMNLSKGVKLFLGSLAVAGIILGTILMLIGTLGLGLAGLAAAFGSLVLFLPVIGKLALVFAGLTAGIMATATAVSAQGGAVSSLRDIWEMLLSKIKGIPIIGEMVEGISYLITSWREGTLSLGDIISGVLKAVVTKIKEILISGFKMVFASLKDLPIIGNVIELFEKVWNAITDWIQEARQIDSIQSAFNFILETMGVPSGIITFIDKVWNKLRGWIDLVGKGKLFDAFADILETLGVPPEIITFLTKLWDNVTSFIQEAKQIDSLTKALDAIIHGITKFGEWGFYIAGEIAKGIIDGLKEKLKDKISIRPSISPSAGAMMGGAMMGGGMRDFIWRPGFAPVPFSPSDTLVGTKSGGGTSTVINANTTFNISATISSGMDVEELANDLNARFEETVRTLIR